MENNNSNNLLTIVRTLYDNHKEAFELVENKLIEIIKELNNEETDIYLKRVESRIKQFSSLESKLVHRLNEDHSDITIKNISELSEYIHDIVGVRVVCIYKNQVLEMFKRIRNQIEKDGFDIVNMKLFIPSDNKSPDPMWNTLGFELIKAVNKNIECSKNKLYYFKKDSNYTSAHIVVKLKKGTPLWKKLGRFNCEIQFRTLLENVSAEIEHKSFYKGSSNYDILKLCKILTNFLHDCDILAHRIKEIIEIDMEKNVEIFSENIPDFDFEYHPFYKKKNLNNTEKKIMDEIKIAYNLRKNDKKFEESNQILKKILEYLKEQGLDKESYYANVHLEIAFNYLKMNELEEAKVIYDQYIDHKNKTIKFWANYRLYFYYMNKRNYKAIIDNFERIKNLIRKGRSPNYSSIVDYTCDGLSTLFFANFGPVCRYYACELLNQEKTKEAKRYFRDCYSYLKLAIKFSEHVSERNFRAYATNNTLATMSEDDFKFQKRKIDIEDLIKTLMIETGKWAMCYRDTVAWALLKLVQNSKSMKWSKITEKEACKYLTESYNLISQVCQYFTKYKTALQEWEKNLAFSHQIAISKSLFERQC